MSFFDRVSSKVKKGFNDISDAFEAEKHSHTHLGEKCHHLHHHTRNNRFHSFAPPRSGNDAKWFVDGCGYMWAVSVALEEAKESIWILDWWLSPELYLRRPPTANENYRVDRMLIAAAERGVKVNIIVYKEVAQALTLCSEHTKHALEVHPNIAVFRHPDHAPSGQAYASEIVSGFKNFSLKTFDIAKLPEDGLKALYGANDDIILYWAHHEKLCLIDGTIAFMGGLDLCFGRWDTNSHPIADAHPTDVDQALFPGQDFNNARVYDFEDVTNFMNNKLDRTTNSRMGWSDLSLCLHGPVVEDLRAHFVQRWNFIYNEKYDMSQKGKYRPLSLTTRDIPDGYYQENGMTVQGVEAIEDREDNPEEEEKEAHRHFHLPGGSGSIFDSIHSKFRDNMPSFTGRDVQQHQGMSVQLVRSCARWSNGCSTEHSIANAYIEVIRKSEHFVYIENQFFITATDDHQKPVRNKIGAALVERIVRAHENGEKYKVIVCMPAVPAFAGDLHADDSLGTRAIMEYQYHSICRGGHSIIEAIEAAGVPQAKQYIRFFNLRNYDRINANSIMSSLEKASGVKYEDARKEHDDIVGAGYVGRGEETGAAAGQPNREYDRYQSAASGVPNSRYDSVSECYMDGGPSVKDIPWAGSEEAEFDAFVSEELYIHSKVLIADDRVVICGSANLNDRSQLGYHDSEIAVIIEDPEPVESVMGGEPFQASRYATSLRRQLFRKHLGLLPWQDWAKPTANFMPINKASNDYDWGSPADLMVRDVLSHEFSNLWNGTALANTEVFNKAFHCVPADNVRDWKQYEEFFGKHFVTPGGKDENKKDLPPKYAYGHVVKEEFPGGVSELKDWLDRVRGTLVEMPLLFMDGVDFAKEGLSFNAFTAEVYT
ncbi:Phospholipase D1 [Lachnellula suecica]|uniref:Phospholipase n=1 Tax=Lachnellula suecica TaxID=602035 RepID=A0A8T9BV02_9HELO|nr:Phospholipase D1 [Lachnellula suecica]